ncbi:hypothetical protein E4U41_003556, partial [Claviceps citrina]
MQHGREPFPTPSAAFAAKKTKILQQLAVPEAEYADASPKGTIDTGIRHLIDRINAADGFVTTSSCAGRVSVFLQGRREGAGAGEGQGQGQGQGQDAGHKGAAAASQVAGVGGKGAGGTWLFVSHDVVEGDGWLESLAFGEGGGEGEAERAWESSGGRRRLIHFKFEPMILHILTASPAHAQTLLQAALQAGFRESGALNITPPQADSPPTPLVAIRSMGLSFESLVGYESAARHALVTRPYLRALMDIATERFAENAKRIERFGDAFRDGVLEHGGGVGRARIRINPEGREWEDGARRRERMREEGLRRREEALRRGGRERGE